MESIASKSNLPICSKQLNNPFRLASKQIITLVAIVFSLNNVIPLLKQQALALQIQTQQQQIRAPPQQPLAPQIGDGRQPWANTNNLRRSFSDPRLNRNFNHTNNNNYNHNYNNNNFHRQSSFDRKRFSDNEHCSTNYKYDYIQLTLQWAPGVCSTSPQVCQKIENKHFTVHGMWPTIKGTQEPANCCFDNTFDFRALEPIMGLLNDYWFSYFDKNSRHFWSHEWLKHGTCSRDVPNLKGEAKYFGTTVQLAKQLPILDELKKANIIPNREDKIYSSSQIIDILTSTISQGKTIQIDCDYEHDQPIPILTGLNFCFDTQMKPANCPEMKKRCKKQILFRL